MKKILLISFLFLSVFFLIPGQARADLTPFVQCGLTADDPCSFCDFFAMISRIVQFAIKIVVPAIASLMLVIGGVYLFFAGSNPGALETGKKIIFSTVIGLVVIFAAFMIVGTILNALGLADWTAEFYKNWIKGEFFQITGCESGTPSPSASPAPPTTPTPTPPVGNEPIPPLPPTPPAF